MVKDIEKQMAENGLDFSKFYSMNLNIPLGSTVELKIDGKKIDVSKLNKGFNNSVDSGFETDVSTTENATENDKSCKTDEILQKISNSGYVKNTHLWRRWITAQTFKMLNYKNGWDAYLRKNISWKYCFSQISDEFYAQYRMISDSDFDEFAIRNHFFNKNTFIALIKDYIRQFEKCCYKGKIQIAGVELDRIENFKDILQKVENCSDTDLYRLHCLSKNMYWLQVRLPIGTPLSSVWKNAYRGTGAYYTLKNLIMWHGVSIYKDDHPMNTYSSLRYLNQKLNDFGSDFWKFHELLKDTIKRNDFNLVKSINR